MPSRQSQAKAFLKEGEGGKDSPFSIFSSNLTKRLHLKHQQAYQESNSKIMKAKNK